MNTISIVTSQNIELEYELGSLGDRIVGRILDLLVIVGYVLLLLVVIGFGNIESVIGSNPLIIIVFILPIVFYDLISELLLNGQSVGKKVMGIKVVSLNGEQPTFSQYLIRWLFRVVDFSMSSGLVALLTVLISEKKQRLGDMVAGTVLVKTNPRTLLSDTWFQPTVQQEYVVSYPEVVNLKDSDVQLIKEVLNSANRSGNVELVYKAQQKVQDVLNIKSKHLDSKEFLYAVLSDYNHLTAQL